MAGFFRDGCCNTSDEDAGRHTVCVQVDEKFLEFSKACGNDLSTPIPQFDLLIAALVIDKGLTLVTTDNHFGQISELKSVILCVSYLNT